MRKELIYIIIVALAVFACFICYNVGYEAGTSNVLYVFAEKVPELIDIQLTPRAKWALLSQPRFLYYILTPESIEKLLSDMNQSAEAKGGIGPDIVNSIVLKGGG